MRASYHVRRLAGVPSLAVGCRPVAILSASEFEAVITQVINRLEKELVALGSNDTIEKAHRDLVTIRGVARQGPKLKAQRASLDKLTDAISSLLHDDRVLNQLWDLLDYIDYRA
jgi:hypothetical protein